MIHELMVVLVTTAAVTGQAGFSGIQGFGPIAAALMSQGAAPPQHQQLHQLHQQQLPQQGGELPPGLAHLQLQLSNLLQQQQQLQHQQQQLASAGYYQPAAPSSFAAHFPSVSAASGTGAPPPAAAIRAQALPLPGKQAPAPAHTAGLLGVAFSPANTASQLRFSGFGANYSY